MIPHRWIDAYQPADGPPPDRLGPFVRWALSGAWPVLALAAVVSILAGVAEVVTALLLGGVVDVALDAPAGAVFATHGGFMVVALVFFLLLRPAVLGLGAYFNTMVTQPQITALILTRLHRYTLGQDVTFFDNDFAGRIAQKEVQTARALNDVINDTLQTVMFALASVVGSVVLLGTIDGRIAIGLVVWIAGYVLTFRYFMPRIRTRSRARAAARADVSGQIVDTVTNIKTVKLFGHSAHEDQAALGAIEVYRQRFLEFGQVSVWFRFWLMTLAGLLPVILVGAALWYWNRGLVSAGDIAATGAVSLRLAQMTGWVSFTLMQLYANVGEVEDGVRTLSARHRLLDAPGATDIVITGGRIDFRGVQFAYGREIGGVQDITLTISPGEKVGIVGASGAGKSTLVALLLRLYDTENGQILIDGQEISGVAQESLRSQIGMVTQDTAMFNRTARDNIGYGQIGLTDEALFAAARKAEAHDFILSLRDHKGRQGYDAFLGERGVKLSGGQRQRIALARAILKDAPILVLDEATSALDSEVEAAIQSALARVMEGKTVLAIAHRLSTISHMDRIIVMDEGRIVEEGTHDRLLAGDGHYARFWHRQSGGFLGTRDAAE